MYHIKECIVVEGVYDKIKLSQIVDGVIFVTNGFAIFNNKKELETIKTFAEKCGIVILTDSDAAGFKIRNYIKQAMPAGSVKHAYIPEIPGKERRKNKPGKEGILGVEGISDEIITDALKKSGCEINGVSELREHIPVTKTDLFVMGLSGGANSSGKRAELCRLLNLPGKISANMLLDSINAIMTREEFFEICDRL